MQLGNFYNEMISMFTNCMDRTFGGDMKITSSLCQFENRGFFKLEYYYSPHDYRIVIENEMNLYDITIIDNEQASNSLFRICKFKNQLSGDSIEDAVSLLKTVLVENRFSLYFHKDGKLYRKNCDGVKRVKDLSELLRG